MATSYTETFSFDNPMAIAALGMSYDMDELLNRTIREHDRYAVIAADIEQAITEQIRRHGVTEDGEWLGRWSAEQVVREVLTGHGVPCPA